MSKSYKITNIVDILNIPTNHIAEFLEDLQEYHATCRPLIKSGIAIALPDKYIIFTPDGKHKIKLNYLIKNPDIKNDHGS